MGFILCIAIGILAFLLGWQIREHNKNEEITKLLQKWKRALTLIGVTLLAITIYGFSKDEIINFFTPKGADATISQWIISIILGAVPAFFLWKWKNDDKQKDQEQTECELNFTISKYNTDKFSELQDILEDGSNTGNKRLNATYELADYYKKPDNYPERVHSFLKYNLYEYWKKHKTDTQAPIYIKAIYHQLNEQDKIFVSKELSLSGFHINYYKTSRKDLSNLDLSDVVWDHADLSKVNLSNTNLKDASLKEAIMTSANLENAYFFCTDLRGAKFKGANMQKADLQNANLVGADLSLIKYDNETDFRGFYLRDTEKFKKILEEVKDHTYNIDLLKPTIFPKGFSPQEHGMQEVCEYYDINRKLPDQI